MVIHLFNLLNAPSERTWLDVALLLSGQFPTTLGYETLAEPLEASIPTVQLPRVLVPPVRSEEVAGQMDAIASDAGHPLRAQVGSLKLAHGHTGPRLLHAAPLLKSGKPVVLSLYGYDASRLLTDPAWVARYRWAADHGARFATLCHPMSRRLVEAGIPASQIHRIPLGVHLDQWPFEPMKTPSHPRYVFIGRLVPKKGIDDLLHAMSQLCLTHRSPTTRPTLDVVGSGPLDEQLRQLAHSLDIAGQVTFHGALPRWQISSLCRSATALVLPSKTAPDGDAEGTPIVLMEAQAIGLPCVTTRHMGNPEVLSPDSPFLASESDPASLASAMLGVHQLSPDERSVLQQAGRRHIELHYDITVTASRYRDLYLSLL